MPGEEAALCAICGQTRPTRSLGKSGGEHPSPSPSLQGRGMMAAMKHFDCIVIGTGPAGQKGAIQAAKLGKRVAIIEKNLVLGGAQINTGTIPSKALREAALHLTGANQRGLFGSTLAASRSTSPSPT